MSPSDVSQGTAWVLAVTKPIKVGVSTIPSKPESVALNTAAATSPLAIAVMATDDEIVEDKTHR